MAAEQRVNNRRAQSTTESRASESYTVDLTSVCIRSGTVRLPLSLLGRFEEGEHTVTADGEELLIAFEPPRTLTGLTPFFQRNELRTNDQVRFDFDGDRLVLHCQKRDRTRASSRGSEPAAKQPAKDDARGGAPAGSSQRLSSRGLYEAPAELVDDTERNGRQAEGGSATGAAAPAAEPEGQVRAVRRVRIEGGLQPRTDTVAPRPLDLASAHEVWARRQQPNWRPLDTTVAGPVVPPEEAAEAFSDTTVRVIRRSKGTSLPLEAEAPPLPAPASTAETYSTSWPHADERLSEREAAPRPASDASGEPRSSAPKQVAAASPAQPLDPYLDAPIDAAREEANLASRPTILESDLLSVPGGGGAWREESEAAYRKYQEVEAEEPVAVQVERRQGFLGRLGFGRTPRAAQAPAERQHPARASEPAPDTGAAGGTEPRGPAPAGTAVQASTSAPAAVSDLSQKAVAAGAQQGAPAAIREPRVIVDESVYDVDFDTDVQPHLASTGAVSSVESDMATLQEYLDRPDVPAIVRCDELAERLSMSHERVSQAMIRLSEDRERFTPLRGDAYMVRRVR